jgi:hypothetical protein
VPDLQGADVTRHGAVVGMIELGWSGARLAICEQAFDAPDWNLVVFNPQAGQTVTEVVATVLRKIRGTVP